MTKRVHFVGMHYTDDSDNEHPVLVQMRLAEIGDLADPKHRTALHRLLDMIIKEFQLLETENSECGT